MRSLLVALWVVALSPWVHAADIYGYVDARGVAHFASEPLDSRYQLFFRAGQSFDTAKGVAPLGRSAKRDARNAGVPPASQTLLTLFNASPGYKIAKAALRDASRTHSIDYELLQALIATESGFDSQAVSPKGAIGLMQVMPDTAQRYGVRTDARGAIEQKLFDPKLNISTGSRYLRDLIAMFPGQIELALAAYNAGEGAVQRAGNKIPNYPETQNYVATVLQLYAYLKPTAGGIAVPGGTRGGKAPGRVHMEMGGAIGRGNLPPAQPARMPDMPDPPAAPTQPANE
ncbi:lytic transglycosylase domain-containing protein [Variovorax sp. J22R133]|uniref:lytic transglycosylase domain-containing protein n=1 Tax=Variovorax brevis TaxID=3053503 RepID=UPI00257554BD|nr:lytic transglycosylase domain-containing protein [Variovorax sp. J22R133]MDM0113374.1 lytic transglycosylase domain-containing protein [Variovorax sp. J22R133]